MPSPSDKLIDIVAEEAALIEQFVGLLEAEQVALTQGNTDELARIAAEKEPRATDLQNIARLRESRLTASGLSPDRRGMADWTAKHPEAVSAWEKTLALASRARDINRLNGELIAMRMQYNARILEILQRNTTTLDLYGPDGKTSGQGERRIEDSV